MKDLMSYKNYNGSVEYSKEDHCLYGKILGIKSLLLYEGESVSELEQDFRNTVDSYLEDCTLRGVSPEIPYKGTFKIRITPELHRNAEVYAYEHGITLDAVVEESIKTLLAANE